MMALKLSNAPKWSGIQPPKNTVAPIAATINILINSAKKKNANFIPEYSVWKPAVSSDSASAKSNGARFVSNKNAIIIRPVKPKNIKISQIFSCTITKAANENDSVITTQLIINKPKNNSRFNISTPHLIEAKKAYFCIIYVEKESSYGVTQRIMV